MRDKGILVALVAIVAAVALGTVALRISSEDRPSISSSQSTQQLSAALIPFTTVVRGVESPITERVNYLITSAADLALLWKMIAATGTPPTVDFTTHAVVAVFAGAAETASAISVTRVEDTASRLVSITIEKPSGTCTKTVASTTPYEIVALPLTTLPFTHEDAVATTSCQ